MPDMQFENKRSLASAQQPVTLRSNQRLQTYPDDNLVNHLVEVALLDERLRCWVIHQQFGVTTGKHNQPIAPACVTHRAASQQQVTDIKSIRLSRPQQSTVELADSIVWCLTHHFPCHSAVP